MPRRRNLTVPKHHSARKATQPTAETPPSRPQRAAAAAAISTRLDEQSLHDDEESSVGSLHDTELETKPESNRKQASPGESDNTESPVATSSTIILNGGNSHSDGAKVDSEICVICHQAESVSCTQAEAICMY